MVLYPYGSLWHCAFLYTEFMLGVIIDIYSFALQGVYVGLGYTYSYWYGYDYIAY